MPLYEYECKRCGRREEVLQRVGAPPVGRCDECGGKMVRLVSAPAFQFKGSGWYVTDYARKGGSGSGGDGEAKSESADTKPGKADTSATIDKGKDNKKTTD